MKALKISTFLAALAASFTFSSCLDDGNSDTAPRFTSYVTIAGDATFGYTFHSDFGCTLKPTSASIQEVLPGLSQANVKRAVVAFDLLNDAKFAEGTIENKMVNEQILKDVRALIDELPDCQREVVFMRYYQDMSFKEIADITGVSINTALGRMRYAVLNMRRIAAEKNVSLVME